MLRKEVAVWNKAMRKDFSKSAFFEPKGDERGKVLKICWRKMFQTKITNAETHR